VTLITSATVRQRPATVHGNPELPQPWDLTGRRLALTGPAPVGATFASFLRTNPAFPLLWIKAGSVGNGGGNGAAFVDRESSLSLEGIWRPGTARAVKLPFGTNGDLMVNTVILVSVMRGKYLRTPEKKCPTGVNTTRI